MDVKLIILVHVLGATIWTGGHLVLALGVLPDALRRRDPSSIAAFEARFERLGIPALLVQIASGLWLAHRYLPDPAQWLAFDSPLAAHIGAKLILLALTLALAVHARVRLVPRLGPENLNTLAYHIIGVTVLAVLLVVMGVGIRAGGWI
jgi:putative copper export protein